MKQYRMIKMVAAVFLAALLLGGCAWLSGVLPGSTGRPEPGFPHQTSDLAPDPALVFGRLDNGFSYVLMENRRPENRVYMHLLVDAGSFHETDDQQGLAHFLEHMLFCGSTHFPPGELIRYFQKIGMRFGNDANAQTGFFHTIYDLHLPAGDEATLREGLVVMTDYAEGALLLAQEVDREREVILAEKRTRDSVDYRTFVATLGFELPDTRIANRLPIGTEPVIRAADGPALKAFYDTWYRPDKMALVVAGDMDAAMAETLVRQAFGAMAARATKVPVPDFGTVTHQGEKAFYHFEKEAGATEITLETMAQSPLPPDSKADKKARFIRDMAFWILDNRLTALAESEAPPFTSASTDAGRVFKEIEYAHISATCPPESWEKALSAIEQELRRALAYGFTLAEVEEVRREMLKALEMNVRQAPTRESGDLAGGILHSLAADRVLQSPLQEQKLLAPVAEKITPALLHRALKNAWESEPRLVLVTGNADLSRAGTAPETRILSVLAESRLQPVDRPEEKEVPVFPYLPDPSKPGKAARRTHIEDLDIHQVDFENGVRLNIRKTDFQADQVSVRVGFGPGESAEPSDKQALAELAAAVINESGFGKMTNEEIRRVLAGATADFSFSVGQDRFELRGGCASDEVNLLFQMFYSFYNDLACRPDARQRSLEQLAQHYEELTHTIDGAMDLFGDRFLAGGDSRFGLPPSYDLYANVSADDMCAWVARAMAGHAPEISVVGDVDVERVIDTAALYFGTMVFENKAPEDTGRPGLPFFPAGKSLTVQVPTVIKKARVEVAWPTDDCWDIFANRRLSILADILTDRMRTVIREETGQSYSQFAYHQASCVYPDYGALHAVVNAAPAEAGTVAAQIRAIAADIVKNGVTADEVRRAVDPALTQIRKMVKENRYWLGSVLAGSREHPERLEWARTLLADYASISPEEITALARQYLKNDKSAAVIIVPEPEAGGRE
ncbi:MAG: M16 family metallopeptidase [Thermodesulfobacteriota bacterium]